MFQALEMAPADAVLGLAEAFREDPNPHKINLSVGVYKDGNGETSIFKAVKDAEQRLVHEEKTKSYLSIQGAAEYGAVVQDLLFGSGHEVIASQRAATADTPGGTGAIRVASDTIAKLFPEATLWLSQPTWPNHPSIFEASGLKVATYPYYDAA